MVEMPRLVPRIIGRVVRFISGLPTQAPKLSGIESQTSSHLAIAS